MEKPASLSSTWDVLVAHLEQHLTNQRYHLLSLELQLAAAILQQTAAAGLLESLLPKQIALIEHCLIAVGSAADEAEYRDTFHKTLVNPWHKLVAAVNPEMAQTLLTQVKHKAPTTLSAKPRFHFSHDFHAFYPINPQANPYQRLKNEQEDRLKRLEGDYARNRYVIYAEIIVPYLKCLIRSRRLIVSSQIKALAAFMESLAWIASSQQPGHEELWHYLLPLQQILADELVYQHYKNDIQPEKIEQWVAACIKQLTKENNGKAVKNSPHARYGETLFLWQSVISFLNQTKELTEVEIIQWLSATNVLSDYLTSHSLQPITCELFQAEQHQQMLASYRDSFKADNYSLAAQKTFSENSTNLLGQLVEPIARLLGDSPCEWTLVATGSTARLDRRLYSDVESFLLYQARPNATPSHTQTYLYFLLSCLEIVIKQLGETHCEYTASEDTQADRAGFHLDSSCHVLRQALFGTPTDMVNQYIVKIPADNQEEAGLEEEHPWCHDRKFYAMLMPKLVYGSTHLLNIYRDKVNVYLNEEISETDQLNKLAQALELATFPALHSLRHQAIAMSCLYSVVQASYLQLNDLNPNSVCNLKEAFYKPLVYLALNLKLYYALKAEHPAEIVAEAAQSLAWGKPLVVKLLQGVMGYITVIQNDLHQKHGHQEECIVWLGTDPVHNKQHLTAVEYAGLSLIKNSLLLPLYHWLEKTLKDPTSQRELIDVLPFLLRSYLAKRNESWLRSWMQHPSHALDLSILLQHPLLTMLAEAPCPQGWSPRYEQNMITWLKQVRSLASTEKTACVVEGLPGGQPHYLAADIVDRLFKNGEFVGNVYHSPNSQVSQLTWQANTFYFKVKAGNQHGLMGREFAVINLHQLLGGGSHIALGWPVKLTYTVGKKPHTYYCWVSQGIDGVSLDDIMRDKNAWANFRNNLDSYSYSHLVVTDYLTCPEDGQPANYKAVQTASDTKTLTLYGLDVGYNFVGIQHEQPHVPMMKTILYLLESAIYQPLDETVLAYLMLLEPTKVIEHWRMNLEQMNQSFQPLFETNLANHRLVDLSNDVIRGVSQRLSLLINWLYQHPSQPKSSSALINALDKAAAFIYQSYVGKINTPEDFYAIDTKAYIKNNNTGKYYSSTMYEQIQQGTLTPQKLQMSLGIGEDYFAHIDFEKITDEDEQLYLVNVLTAAIHNKKRFTYLNLSGCRVMDQTELFNLLQKMPELEELRLENCSQFNFATLLDLLSFKFNNRLTGFFQFDYEVLCPKLKRVGLSLNGKVQTLEVDLTVGGRKKLVEVVGEWQIFINQYINKLLNKFTARTKFVQKKLKDDGAYLSDDEYLMPRVKRGLAISIDRYLKKEAEILKLVVSNLILLTQSLSKISNDHQLIKNKLIDKLFIKFSESNKYLLEEIIKAFEQIYDDVAESMKNKIIDKILLAFENGVLNISMMALNCLGNILGKMSKEKVNQAKTRLVSKLGNKSIKFQLALIKVLGRITENLNSVELNKVLDSLLSIKLNFKDEETQEIVLNLLFDFIRIISKEKTELIIKQYLSIFNDVDSVSFYFLKKIYKKLINLAFNFPLDVTLEFIYKLLKINLYIYSIDFLKKQIADLFWRLSDNQRVDLVFYLISNLFKLQAGGLSEHLIIHLAPHLSFEKFNYMVGELISIFEREDCNAKKNIFSILNKFKKNIDQAKWQFILFAFLDHLKDKDDVLSAGDLKTLKEAINYLSLANASVLLDKLVRIESESDYFNCLIVDLIANTAIKLPQGNRIEIVVKLIDRFNFDGIYSENSYKKIIKLTIDFDSCQLELFFCKLFGRLDNSLNKYLYLGRKILNYIFDIFPEEKIDRLLEFIVNMKINNVLIFSNILSALFCKAPQLLTNIKTKTFSRLYELSTIGYSGDIFYEIKNIIVLLPLLPIKNRSLAIAYFYECLKDEKYSVEQDYNDFNRICTNLKKKKTQAFLDIFFSEEKYFSSYSSDIFYFFLLKLGKAVDLKYLEKIIYQILPFLTQFDRGISSEIKNELIKYSESIALEELKRFADILLSYSKSSSEHFKIMVVKVLLGVEKILLFENMQEIIFELLTVIVSCSSWYDWQYYNDRKFLLEKYINLCCQLPEEKIKIFLYSLLYHSVNNSGPHYLILNIFSKLAVFLTLEQHKDIILNLFLNLKMDSESSVLSEIQPTHTNNRISLRELQKLICLLTGYFWNNLLIYQIASKEIVFKWIEITNYLSKEQIEETFFEIFLCSKAGDNFNVVPFNSKISYITKMKDYLPQELIQKFISYLLLVVSANSLEPQHIALSNLIQMKDYLLENDLNQIFECLLTNLKPENSNFLKNIIEKIMDISNLLSYQQLQCVFARLLLQLVDINDETKNFILKAIIDLGCCILKTDSFSEKISDKQNLWQTVWQMIARVSSTLSVETIFEIANLLLPNVAKGNENMCCISTGLLIVVGSGYASIVLEKIFLEFFNSSQNLQKITLQGISQLEDCLTSEQFYNVITKLLLPFAIKKKNNLLSVQTTNLIAKFSVKLSITFLNSLIDEILDLLENNSEFSLFKKEIQDFIDNIFMGLGKLCTIQQFSKIIQRLVERGLEVENIFSKEVFRLVNKYICTILPEKKRVFLSDILLKKLIVACFSNEKMQYFYKFDIDVEPIIIGIRPYLESKSYCEIIRKTWMQLNKNSSLYDDKNTEISCLKILKKYFSIPSLFALLKCEILNIQKQDLNDINTNSLVFGKEIMPKVFSLLDKKTLLKVVPLISKDWQSWQKVYLHNDAERMRVENNLSEEQSENTDAIRSEQNNFKRFFL